MKLCKLFIVIVVCLGSSTLGVASERLEVKSLSLEDITQLALETSPEVMIAELEKEKYRQDVGIALSEYLPKLTGFANYNRTLQKRELIFNDTAVKIGSDNTYQAGARFSQILLQGDKLWKSLSASQLGVKIGQAEVEATQAQIVYVAKQRFYALLLAQHALRMAENFETLQSEILATIQKRYRSGLEHDLTLSRQEAIVSEAEAQVVNTQKEVAMARLLLAHVMGATDTEGWEIHGEFPTVVSFTPDLAKIKAVARSRPDVRSNLLKVEALQKNWEATRAELWPKLKWVADYSWEAQTDNFGVGGGEDFNTANVGLQLEIPIFDGLGTYRRYQRDKLDWKIVRERHKLLELTVDREAEAAHLNLISASKLMGAIEKKFSQYKKANEIARQRYKAGLLSHLEYQDVETQGQQSQLSLAEARYTYAIALAEMDRVEGIFK